MAKQKPVVSIRSFGIYDGWDEKAKGLPQITEFTTRVRAEIDVEFGFIVNIKRAKNAQIRYCIYHPDIPDDQGVPRPPFDGQVYVKSNDWDFYLGDTIWAPLENKLGDWRMTLELADQVVADKTFSLYVD